MNLSLGLGIKRPNGVCDLSRFDIQPAMASKISWTNAICQPIFAAKHDLKLLGWAAEVNIIAVGWGAPLMCKTSPGQIQPKQGGPGHAIQRLKWGVVFAGLYLLVSVPCAVVYHIHHHEYSIPMLIVSYASFPVQFVMSDVLRPLTAHIERWPYGEVWFLSILLGTTTLLYFFLGQCLGWVVRTTARFFSREHERMET